MNGWKDREQRWFQKDSVGQSIDELLFPFISSPFNKFCIFIVVFICVSSEHSRPLSLLERQDSLTQIVNIVTDIYTWFAFFGFFSLRNKLFHLMIGFGFDDLSCLFPRSVFDFISYEYTPLFFLGVRVCMLFSLTIRHNRFWSGVLSFAYAPNVNSLSVGWLVRSARDDRTLSFPLSWLLDGLDGCVCVSLLLKRSHCFIFGHFFYLLWSD